MNMNHRKVAATAAQVALDHLHHGLCLFDGSGRVIEMNRRFAEMNNPSVDLEKTLADYLRDAVAAGSFAGDPDEYAEKLLSAMRAGETVQMLHEYDDGRFMLITDTPTFDGGFLSTHEDVTDRIRAEKRVRHMATHDLLTDLGNRASFQDELASALLAGRTKRQQFALAYVDLDRFKEINDIYGHSVGDAYLRKVAHRLQDAAQGAFVARLGGDEFAIIQPGRQPDSASALVERLQRDVAGELQIGDRTLQVSLSIGVALYPEDGLDAAVLINNADAAMYRAKNDGRGAARFFKLEMDESLRERRALESDLHGAAGRGELILHYQPQATIEGLVTGFEALIRWKHPRRGLLPPAKFIPLAEQNGTIVEIGAWVLKEACAEAASWEKPLSISVNLSAVQFRHTDLPQIVADALRATGLEPDRLEIELTETTLINDHARALELLKALKMIGVRIALDDFGTGFSSLSYLRSFPFDKIKIDRSFIAEISGNPASAAIVKGVIGLARELGMTVTAEGVETEEQVLFLTDETCGELQGFRIGRPAPISEHAGHLQGREVPV